MRGEHLLETITLLNNNVNINDIISQYCWVRRRRIQANLYRDQENSLFFSVSKP